jgi:carbohydrate-selective porin OprB
MEWDEEQWGGNYRLYYWGNDRKHTKIVEYGVDPNTGTTDVSTRLNRANYGFGMSLDQKITDVYGVFGRAGWQRPELVPIAGTATLYAAWSAGAQMTGKYWNRTDDVLGAAIGTVYPSERYSSSTDPGRPSSPETHFETYYNIRINPHLSISPDLQWIWDPFGVGRADQGDHDAIFIYGLRCQLDF